MKTKLTLRAFASPALAFFLLALLHSAYGATTYYVATTGSDAAVGTSWATARQTIQAAVDLAVAGDNVIVGNGVYATGGRVVAGKALTNRVMITSAITVHSANGPAVTIIQGAQVPGTTNGNAAVRCVYLGENAALFGFTLTNGATLGPIGSGSDQFGGGVYCQSSSVVSNCFLLGNAAGGGGGSYEGTLNNCTLSGNSASSGGGTVGGTLNNCTLVGNAAGSTGGGSASGTLNNCILAGNSAGYGGGGLSYGILNNCSVGNNTAGAQGGGAWESTLTNCTLSGNSAGSGGGAAGGTLDGCTLSGNSAPGGEGGGAWGSTLNDCTLSGNSAPSGGGTSGGTLNHCTLSNNTVVNYGGGSYQGSLTNCTLSGNSALSGGGAASAKLANCTLWGNQAIVYGGGSYQGTLNNCTLAANSAQQEGGGSRGDTLTNCIVYFNTAPTGSNYSTSTCNYTCTTPLPAGPGNITNAPLFVATNDLHLLPGSSGIDAGNNASVVGVTDLNGNPRIVHGIVDLGAYEDQGPFDQYVTMSGNDAADGRSWATAKQTIQSAVDVTIAGDTVTVSNGVYATGGRVRPGFLLTNRVMITRSITLRSLNGPGVTFIQGAIDPIATNGVGAVRCAYLGTNATLIGFTLTNGATLRANASILDLVGGGVWCETSAMVSNCFLLGNAAFQGGGGSYQGTLNNSTLSGNSGNAGGGGSHFGTLNHCTLSGNSAQDGGGAQRSTLNHCTLSGNSAWNGHGGGAFFGTLNNCILSGNSAMIDGGGSFFSSLTNCTLSGNSAGNSGGGAYDGTLNNCIAYFNTAPTGPNYNFSAVNYSCSTPVPGGTANINSNPQFVNAAAGNFHLLPTSPCIDQGNNAYGFGTTDLDGNPRIAGGTVDMGALEFQVTVVLVLTDPTTLGDGTFRFNFTNLTGASFTVVASTDVALPLSQWMILGLAMESPPGSGQFHFTDLQAPNYLKRFYRVRQGGLIIPTNPPVLTGLTVLTNGSFQFGFINLSGASFTVLASTNVALPVINWTMLGAATETSPGQYRFTDPQTTNSPQRYYRVRSP